VHRFVSHTGEVQIEIEAATEAAVFADAALALAELIDGGRGEAATRRLRVEAADRAALLVEWLSELLFLAETDAFVAEEIGELELAEGSLSATASGRTATPRHLVKAITYHDLVLEERGGGWFARIVLDV
jgi:SHS2 domain-containing protein